MESRGGNRKLNRELLSNTERETILIVEDEPALNELIAFHLKGKGYQILTAFDGEKALKLIQNKPDLIILDILIPEPDGWQICKAVRTASYEDVQKTPIIILSALGEEANRIKGLELGADDYLSKPFSIRELILRIDRLLRLKKDQQRLRSNLSSLTVQHEEKTLQIRDLIHDLKNSFLAFQGLTGILGKKNLDARQEEQIRYAVRESRQSMERLLTQLWNTVKEGSLTRSEKDSCNLSEVILSIVKRYQPLASEKGVLLSCQISPIPTVPLKRKIERIGRAVENIIDNALKYTGKGGQVLIQVEYCKGVEKGTEVSLSLGEALRITVSDTGIGVHPERLREIMEGLRPSEAMTEDTLVSFGHGLNFVKRVVEEMGGNLFIESEPQKGTHVTLTFCIETDPVQRKSVI